MRNYWTTLTWRKQVQFEYFEALADLVECEEPIEMEAIYKLFEGADKETVATLLEDYFEDILDGLPENAGEIYSLLHQIKLSLVGMVTNIEDENDLRKFSDEIYNSSTGIPTNQRWS